MSKVKDETGNIYGKLTVLERAGSNSYGKATWLCQCECGKTAIVAGDALRKGIASTCGDRIHAQERMKRVGKSNLIDLAGQTFGLLTVIERVPRPENVKNGTYWKCQCKCGNYHIAEAANLKKGAVASCGCLISKGEAKITSILQSKNINFQTQYYRSDFIFQKTGKHPYFDFAIFDKENNLKCLIEYNGEQHYRAYNRTNTWNTPENLRKVQKRDKEKRQICKQFEIPLYEISYQKFDFLEEIVYNILVEINEI